MKSRDVVVDALKLNPACPQCREASKTIAALLQALQHSRRIARRLRPEPDTWVVEIAKDRRRRSVQGGLVRQDKQPAPALRSR